MLPYSGMFAKLLRSCRIEAVPFFRFAGSHGAVFAASPRMILTFLFFMV